MEFHKNGLTYRVTEGAFCKVAGFDGAASAPVIPRMVDGYTVNAIGRGAWIRCNGLQSVTLPDTVTEIKDHAFYECRSLREIILPDSVKRIGYEAFGLCESLRIRLGKGVTDILSGALNGVRFIGVSPENPRFCADNGNLFSKDKTAFLQYTQKEGEYAFSVPEGTETIGIAAFLGCDGLLEIRLPESLKTIQWSAFEGCKGLKRMKLPEGLEALDGGAFTDCPALEEISVGGALKTVGEYVFSGCLSLKRLFYSGTVAEWRAISLGRDWSDGAPCLRIETKDSALANEKGRPSPFLDYQINAEGTACTVNGIGLCMDTKLVFPTEIEGIPVTKIGKIAPQGDPFTESDIYFEGAFEGRGDVESVFVPEGVTEIGNNTFKNCAALKSVWISGSVKYIGASAFEECRALENVFLAQGVRAVGAYAFQSCTSLREISLPAGLTHIGSKAFAECPNLKTVIFRGSVSQWRELCPKRIASVRTVSCADGEIRF